MTDTTEIAGPESRRVEIERLMTEDRGRAYWRSEALQNEYRAILEREAGAPSPSATAAPGNSGSGLPSVARAPDSELDHSETILADDPAGRRGGDRAPAASPSVVASDFGLDQLTAETAINTAGDIETSFGPGAVGVNPIVMGLPDSLRVRMVAELGSPYMKRTPNATTDWVERFGRTSHGRLLVNRWGDDAPRRLALLLARTDRFESGLSDADYRQWEHFWFHGLNAEQRASIIDKLTA